MGELVSWRIRYVEGLLRAFGQRYFLELFYVVCCQGCCAVPFLATRVGTTCLLHTIGTSLWEGLRTAFGYGPDTSISRGDARLFRLWM